MPEKRIELFGFQAGPEGFVRVGTSPNPILSEWKDRLYLLVHGGRGCGKSRSGAYRAAHYMLTWDRSRGTITAPTYDMFRRATLVSVMEVLRELGLKYGDDWEYSVQNKELTLFNGSTAMFCSTEDPERLKGPDVAWGWMDEPYQSPLVAFTNMAGQLRQQGYPHQCWLTTTPSGKNHWLYKVFYERTVESKVISAALQRGELSGTYLHFAAKTWENPHGGKELYQQLKDLYGDGSLLLRQEGQGEFVLMEGLMYPRWNPEFHVKEEKDWPIKPRQIERVVAGVDFGYPSPSAIFVEGADKEGRRFILETWKRSEADIEVLAEIMEKLKNRHGILMFACDSAGADKIHMLRQRGLPAVRANKRRGSVGDMSGGLGLCARVLGNTNEPQRFFVPPTAVEFINEIENYIMVGTRQDVDPPDRGKKKNDHLLDAWRYSEMLMERLWPQNHESRMGIIPTRLIGAAVG